MGKMELAMCLSTSDFDGAMPYQRLDVVRMGKTSKGDDDARAGMILVRAWIWPEVPGHATVLLTPDFVLIGQDWDCFVKKANHWSRTAANSC